MNIAASDPHRSSGPTPRSAESCNDFGVTFGVTLAFVRASPAECDAAADVTRADGSDSGGAAVPGRLATESETLAGATISAALAPLREVVASLARARRGWFPSAAAQQRLTQKARRVGVSALPALLRSLGAEAEHEATWAHCLLRSIAAPKSRGPLRERVLGRLGQLLRSARHSDKVKARVLALLSDLGAPLGDEVVLRDPTGLLAGSVHELLVSLDGAAEIEQAVDLIFTQVPQAELASFLEAVAQHGGAVARPLFSALLAEPRLPRELALRYMAQYRPTPQPLQAAPARRLRPARERMVTRLSRALNLLHEGKLTQARGRLARLLPEFADQPAVHSALGLCLLRLGEPHDALAHLECARALEPAVAAHSWNHACAAHAAQRPGTCYRSLSGYLVQHDDLEGAASRRRTAEKFCRTYEQSLSRDLPAALAPAAASHLPEPLGGYPFGEEYSGRA